VVGRKRTIVNVAKHEEVGSGSADGPETKSRRAEEPPLAGSS
jgi:hypothetical protein